MDLKVFRSFEMKSGQLERQRERDWMELHCGASE